jgi:hypothetical protein
MSFKQFIYYCAVCGGWAAFATWGAALAGGVLNDATPPYLKAAATAALLGTLIAAAVGTLDALLNSVGPQRIVRVLVCAAVGFVGSAAAGVVGEAINQMVLSMTGGKQSLVLPGWMLVGVAAGASIGVFDLLRGLGSPRTLPTAVHKTLNGVYGGLLGGFVGGLLFNLVPTLGANVAQSSLTVNLVILGLCIGLLIGLAQVVLKEAWLKVESGFRAGREVMLSKAETTIGRAEGNDLGLFGDKEVEKLHARILLKDDRYLIADAGTPGGTYLNDRLVSKPMPLRSGDAIRLGNCVLRFGERQRRS